MITFDSELIDGVRISYAVESSAIGTAAYDVTMTMRSVRVSPVETPPAEVVARPLTCAPAVLVLVRSSTKPKEAQITPPMPLTSQVYTVRIENGHVRGVTTAPVPISVETATTCFLFALESSNGLRVTSAATLELVLEHLCLHLITRSRVTEQPPLLQMDSRICPHGYRFDIPERLAGDPVYRMHAQQEQCVCWRIWPNDAALLRELLLKVRADMPTNISKQGLTGTEMALLAGTAGDQNLTKMYFSVLLGPDMHANRVLIRENPAMFAGDCLTAKGVTNHAALNAASSIRAELGRSASRGVFPLWGLDLPGKGGGLVTATTDQLRQTPVCSLFINTVKGLT